MLGLASNIEEAENRGAMPWIGGSAVRYQADTQAELFGGKGNMVDGLRAVGRMIISDSNARSPHAKQCNDAAGALDEILSKTSAGGRDSVRGIRLSNGGNARVGDE